MLLLILMLSMPASVIFIAGSPVRPGTINKKGKRPFHQSFRHGEEKANGVGFGEMDEILPGTTRPLTRSSRHGG
jgi:hypothetical protein